MNNPRGKDNAQRRKFSVEKKVGSSSASSSVCSRIGLAAMELSNQIYDGVFFSFAGALK